MTTTAQPIKRLLPNGGVLFACGCRTYNEGGFLYLCPLHAAAPRMLAILQAIASEVCDHGPMPFCPREGARAILRDVEG